MQAAFFRVFSVFCGQSLLIFRNDSSGRILDSTAKRRAHHIRAVTLESFNDG